MIFSGNYFLTADSTAIRKCIGRRLIHAATNGFYKKKKSFAGLVLVYQLDATLVSSTTFVYTNWYRIGYAPIW